MKTKRKKNKVPAGISWVFLLFPYYNWIALIVLGVWNSRWLAVLSAFVYCTLHSLFPDQFIEWWICTIVHYLLVRIFLKRKLENDVLLEKEQKKRRRTEHQIGQSAAILENSEPEKQQKQEKIHDKGTNLTKRSKRENALKKDLDSENGQKQNCIQGKETDSEGRQKAEIIQDERIIAERKNDKEFSLNLNFDNINELRRQSEMVRDALEVEIEKKKTGIEEESSDTQEDSLLGNEISGKGKGAKEEISGKGKDSKEEISCREEGLDLEEKIRPESDREILEAKDDKDKIQNVIKKLSKQQKKMLKTILFEDGAAESLEQIAEEVFSMPETMADEINDLAMEYLDDLLIDTNGDRWMVFEQYEEELKKYFAQNE